MRLDQQLNVCFGIFNYGFHSACQWVILSFVFVFWIHTILILAKMNWYGAANGPGNLVLRLIVGRLDFRLQLRTNLIEMSTRSKNTNGRWLNTKESLKVTELLIWCYTDSNILNHICFVKYFKGIQKIGSLTTK